MRILLATLYSQYGGSARILFASRKALAGVHEVVVRAPLAEADSRAKRCIPPWTLDRIWRKLAVLPLVCLILAQEWRFLRTRHFEIIYVHDEPSLYIYGLLARVLGMRVTWNVNMKEGIGVRRWIRNWLCDRKIHVSSLTQQEAGGGGVLIRYPVTVFPTPRTTVREIRNLYQLGSICRRKNQLLAVEAIGILRSRGRALRLHLCGNILEKAYFQTINQRLLELSLTDVVSFDGHVEAADAYEQADLILCPAQYESVGLTLIEALGAGVPVIASDIPAHRETAALVGLNPAALASLKPEHFADAIEHAALIDFAKCSTRVREVFGFDRFAAELCSTFRSFSSPQLPYSRVVL